MDKIYHFERCGKGTAATFIVFQALNCLAALYCVEDSAWESLTLKYCAMVFLAACYYFSIAIGGAKNRYETKIEVDYFGIAYGDTRILWRDIAEIRHGLPFWKSYPLVSIIPKEPLPDEESKRSKVFPERLPGFKFVYEEIIPHMKKRLPDLKVSDNFPDTSKVSGLLGKYGVFSLVLAALLQCVILFYSFERIVLGDFMGIQYPAVAVLIFGFLGASLFGDRLADTTVISSLRGIVMGVGAAFPVAVFSSYLATPPGWTFQALSAFCILALLLGIATLFIPPVFAPRLKTFITILVLTAIATFAYFAKPIPPLIETPFELAKEIPFLIWSADSRFLAEPSVPRKRRSDRFVFDLEMRRRIQIPSHLEEDYIVWMDKERILRTVTRESSGNKYCELFLFNVRNATEIKLDSAESIRLGRRHPISPDGNTLVWISIAKEGKEKKTISTLKRVDLRNIENNNVETLPLDTSDKCAWLRAEWIGTGKLFLIGRCGDTPNPKNPSMLVSMEYDLTTGRYKLHENSQKARYWFIQSEFKSAFAMDKVDEVGKHGAENIRYIDLTFGKTTRLTGCDPPSWVSEKGFAYRIVNTPNGRWLSRFDQTNTSEKILVKVPVGLILLGVSHDGKTAFFVFGGRLSFSTYHLYNVDSKNWRTIETAGLTGFFSASHFRNALVLASPCCSSCAPSCNIAVLRYIHMFPLPINCRIRLLDFN